MKMNNCAEILNKFAKLNESSNYLEIGVMAGATFFDVGIKNKHAVDPKFLFEYKPLETESIKYFEMYSDNFFCSDKPMGSYDLIFLDGLHTFEQTLKDFLNCLPLLNENSIIIIDDVIPSDIYSSNPDQFECYDFRRTFLNSNNTDWHGDIYKLPIFIHNYLPSYRVKIISDQDNFRAVVWREKITGDNIDKSNSLTLDKIYNLDYLGMLRFLSKSSIMISLNEMLNHLASLNMTK